MPSQPVDAFLYTSKLSANAGIDCVASIVKAARAFNAKNGITGILIFDGERFCQYIEGPKSLLNELIERISCDARHCEFNPQWHRTNATERLFSAWSMAYATIDDDEPLQDFSALDGENAMSKFNELLPMLDVS